jgi:hypothetical protein
MRRRFRSEVANRKATRLASQRANTTTTVASPHSSNLPTTGKESNPKTLSTATLGMVSSQASVVSDNEAKEFEETLFKLGQLQRKKVRLEDFTAKDRFTILDLFVNNEKTLLKVYEALFQSTPSRP